VPFLHHRHTAGHTAVRIRPRRLNHKNTASQFLIYFFIIIFIRKLLNNNVECPDNTIQPHYSTDAHNNNSLISHIINIIIILIKCQNQTLSHPGRLDSKSEHPGTSSVDSMQQLGVNVCPHSVNTIQDQSPVKVRSNSSTRSAHYQGDRGVTYRPKRQNPVKGRNF